MTFFERITRKARATAERTIDRRNPLRHRLIESAVEAALNQARADERERQAKLKADRAAALARANAAPAAPIRQQCQVVRKGPAPKPVVRPGPSASPRRPPKLSPHRRLTDGPELGPSFVLCTAPLLFRHTNV